MSILVSVSILYPVCSLHSAVRILYWPWRQLLTSDQWCLFKHRSDTALLPTVFLVSDGTFSRFCPLIHRCYWTSVRSELGKYWSSSFFVVQVHQNVFLWITFQEHKSVNSVRERSILAIRTAKFGPLREPIRMLPSTSDQFSHMINRLFLAPVVFIITEVDSIKVYCLSSLFGIVYLALRWRRTLVLIMYAFI